MKKTSVLLLAFVSLCCFAGVFDAKSFVLHDGAVVENGILKLDGKKAYATIPGTEKISFAAPGVTFACAVKPAFDARKGSGEMMDSYFSRNRAPFTICRWGGLISTRIVNKKTGKYQMRRAYRETQQHHVAVTRISKPLDRRPMRTPRNLGAEPRIRKNTPNYR